MKKIIIALLIFGATVAAAEDSWLYWMVGDNAATYNTVKVRSDKGYLNIYSPNGTYDFGESISAADVQTVKNNGGGLYALLASSGSPYSSFVVELYNDSTFVAQSEALSYSTALADAHIKASNSMSLATVWTATAFAIPEPNSAMLLLIGCSVLALRRRRRSA